MIEKIKEGFINDSLEELNSIELDLLYDRSEIVEGCVIEKVFTAAHKIKGTAPMLGIEGIDHIAESIERVFAALRDGNLSLSDEIVANTKKLIPIMKSELKINQKNNIDSEDVVKSLRFFDSLISKNANA